MSKPSSSRGEDTYHLPGGKVCKGTPVNGKFDGFFKCKFLKDVDKNGKLIYDDYEYEGMLKDGLFHGKGKLIFPNFVSESTFSDDEPDGPMKTTTNDGVVIEGNVKEGKRDGFFKYTYKNNLEHERIFNNGTEDKTYCKLKVKIPKDDFKLAVEYLAEQFKIRDMVFPNYELMFEGKCLNKRPQKGELYIKDVFKFEGKWSTTPGNYKGILYDLVNKTQKEIHMVDNIDITDLQKK